MIGGPTESQPHSKPSAFAYSPALDGVRAFAVLGVMLVHTGLPVFAAGGRGVQVFFVLSGFLITSLLIAEWFNKGRIHLRAFYVRRFLRLYPALLLVLIVTVGVVPLLMRVPAPTTFGLLSILFYFSNWNYALTGTAANLGYLPQMWSLAVEEQFYIVWPAVVIFLLSFRKASRNLLIVAAAIACLSLVQAVVLAQDHSDPHGFRLLGTDVQAGHLMVGCALAVFIARYPGRTRAWLRRLIWPALAVMLAYLGPWSLGNLPPALSELNYVRAGAYLGLFAVGSGVAIGYLYFANPRSIAARIMSFTPLVLIGRISYGMYLWHFPIFVIVRILDGLRSPTALEVSADFALTLGIATLSFVLLERPLLRLKDRLRIQVRPAPVRVAVGGV